MYNTRIHTSYGAITYNEINVIGAEEKSRNGLALKNQTMNGKRVKRHVTLVTQISKSLQLNFYNR